ncbi:CPCC family cysteine-rich protein [Ruminiclostridium cellobioparum]|uniref:Cysteine-rich CPCC domain-containing protein n=1 Tax=Ruminiclostridium cellobioparum subsp. termitidis CT1112 TaxID=1195236 RepID=S0FMA4_RUMCE|nr:CPCC family cysteine-rich protein [Ruminiclostridium cellobioparum]EMS70279.1 hypothetical protein CTER_3985 [Ruminiclostridium cellobioparum subsp. termitidis CT1112]
MKYTCPCCGYKTLDDEHLFDICDICFWEDDWGQFLDPRSTGANYVTLIEGQKNYIKFGACEYEMIPHVRKPTHDDVKDENWKPIDVYNAD